MKTNTRQNARLLLALAGLLMSNSNIDANTLTVTSTADSGPGTLREAVAATAPGGEIFFAPNVTGVITLTSGEMAIGRDLTITGPGANKLMITANNRSRAFNISAGNVAISGLTIAFCATNATGGAIFNQGSLSMFSCTLCTNSAFSEGGGDGGAIENNGYGSLLLVSCTFAGNEAGAYGGAVDNDDSASSATVANCTFSGNFADLGGAINNGGFLRISSCTISGNGAEVGGGIIASVHSVNYGWVGTTTIADSIVSGNANYYDESADSSSSDDVSGQVSSSGFNLIGSVDGSSGWNDSDLKGTHSSPLDPLLGPLFDNGGPTPTMALRDGSAAIDQGNSSGLVQDQRGFPRIYDWANIPNAADGSDIGAYEAHQTLWWQRPPCLNCDPVIHFSILSLAGTTNTMQYNTNLPKGVWSNAAVIVADGSVQSLDVPNDTGLFPQQFYRLSMPAPHRVSVPKVYFDSTVDLAYSNAWFNGSEGGLGFSPWTLKVASTNGGSGFFIGSSTNNGAGALPGIDVGGGAYIDTNNNLVLQSGTSWGMTASSNGLAVAFRSFSNSLRVGSTLRIDMDNGYVDYGDSIGFVLRTATNNANSYTNGTRFQFLYPGPSPSLNYRVVDANGLQSTFIPWTTAGLHLLFTLNTTNTYTLQAIDNASGYTNVVSGTLAGSGTLNSIALFDQNAGSGLDHALYFNSMQIVSP